MTFCRTAWQIYRENISCCTTNTWEVFYPWLLLQSIGICLTELSQSGQKVQKMQKLDIQRSISRTLVKNIEDWWSSKKITFFESTNYGVAWTRLNFFLAKKETTFSPMLINIQYAHLVHPIHVGNKSYLGCIALVKTAICELFKKSRKKQGCTLT